MPIKLKCWYCKTKDDSSGWVGLSIDPEEAKNYRHPETGESYPAKLLLCGLCMEKHIKKVDPN